MEDENISDITIIIGPPGNPDLVSLINKVAEKENIMFDAAWDIFIKDALFKKAGNNEKSDLLNSVFSQVAETEVKISKLFYTHLKKDGHSYPGVIISLNDVIGTTPQAVRKLLLYKSNRDILGAILGLIFKTEWIYVSVQHSIPD